MEVMNLLCGISLESTILRKFSMIDHFLIVIIGSSFTWVIGKSLFMALSGVGVSLCMIDACESCDFLFLLFFALFCIFIECISDVWLRYQFG